MNHQQRNMIRKALTQRVAVLRSRVESTEFRLEATPDEADYASQVTRYTLDIALRERELVQMREIQQALNLLDSPEFGRCRECGDDIATARLLAKPSATLCVCCQEDYEQELSACA